MQIGNMLRGVSFAALLAALPWLAPVPLSRRRNRSFCPPAQLLLRTRHQVLFFNRYW